MPLTVAELQASLSLDIRDLKKGSVEAQREFSDLRKSATGTGAGFDDLKKHAKTFQLALQDLKDGAKGGGDAMGGLRVAAQNVSGVMAQAGVNTGILGAAVGALSSPFGIAAAGAVILGLAIKSTTEFMVQNYTQIRQLMAVSGLEAEAADKLADTFDLLGFNAEALRNSLFRMSAEVDSGGKQLKEIGVDLRSVGGDLKTEGALFLEARDKISAMTSASERNAAAQRIFGRSARDMAEVFALSTAEFNKWLEKAELMGPSAEESVRVTKEYTRAMAEFTKTLQSTVETVGQKVLPPLTELLHVLTALATIASKPFTITASFVVTGWEKFQEIRDKIGDWVNWAATGGRAKIGMGRLDDLRAEPEMDTLGSGALLRKPQALMAAEVEQQRMALKEMEADRLRSIALVQANMQAALKLNQMDESEAAQHSIRLAQQTFAAKAAAIDGEIALVRRTSTEAIRDGTEAGNKIRVLLDQRKGAHSEMAVAVVGFEAAITKAALDGQREIAAGSIEGLKARLASSAALLGIKQQSGLDIVGVQGSDEAAFRARLGAETQAKIDAAEAQTKTSADYAAAVEAIMAAHYAKLGGFLREALERDIAAMPEALGELGRSIALVGDATEADITPMEEAWEDLRLEMVAVEQVSAALGGRFDKTSAMIQIQEQRVRLLAAEYGPLSEKVRAAVGELDRLKAQQFGETLAAIGVEAQLFGDRFDQAGATINAMETRLRDMGRAAGGQVTDDMRTLRAELEGFYQFRDLRDMFQDIFSSVGSAINTLVQGVIMGTQTMGEAFKRLGQSIVIEFVNRVIQQALNPLVRAAAGVVAQLLTGGSGAAPAQQAATAAAEGVNSAGFAPGEPGGAPINTSSIPVINPGTLGTGWSAIQSGYQVYQLTGSFSDAAGSFIATFGEASQAMSGLSAALGYVAAAVQGFMIIMDDNKTDLGKGIQTAILAAGLALSGVTFGISAIAAPIVNWLLDLFGVFSKGPSSYDLKRIAAADEANQALGGVTGGYQSALNTGDPAQILAALQGGGGGAAGNSVRTELVLPSNIAAQIGLTGQQIGDQVVTQWKDVTLEQFQQVLAAFKGNPDLVQNLRGSGDVPYLAQGDAEAIAEQIRQGAIALLIAFGAMEEVKDKIRELATDLGAAAKDILPPDLAEQFATGIVNPIRDRMLSVINSGLPVDEMQKQMDALAADLQKQTEAWSAFGSALTQAIDLDALLSGLTGLGDDFRDAMEPEYDAIVAALVAGNATLAKTLVEDFQKQVAVWASIGKTITTMQAEVANITGNPEAAIAAWQAVQGQMDRTVERLRGAFDRAVESGDVEKVAAAAAAYHEATIARLGAEMAMVKQIEEAVNQAIAVMTTLVQQGIRIAQLEIGSTGSLGTIQALLGALEAMATSGSTVAQRMWAVQAGIQAIIAVLPGLIEQFADFASAVKPAEITGAVIAGATPFLGAQQAEIDAAKGPARLALLQQQAATFEALAKAAIDGVTQWATQGIAGAREATQIAMDGLAEQRDLQLSAIDLQIEGIQLAQEARRAEIEALQDQIAKVREFAAAIEGMGKFIESLKVGPLGPGNPADKLAQAQSSFAKALQAYTADPTAGGLTNLQGLAQSMLSLAEPIFSKPSPQFQALSATTIKQLDAALAMAEAMATDSEVLQAQLDALVALDKTASKAAADQIDALNAQKQSITDNFETQTKALEAALKTEVAAIEKAAKDEIDAINGALITALKTNAAEQAGLVKDQLDKTDLLIKALTSSEFEGVRLGDIAVYAAKRQDVAIGILEDIRAGIDAAVGAQSRTSGVEAAGTRATGGGATPTVDAGGVRPNPQMPGGTGPGGTGPGPTSTAGGGYFDTMSSVPTTGNNNWSLDSSRARDFATEGGFAWGGPKAQELNYLESQIGMLRDDLMKAGTLSGLDPSYHRYNPALFTAKQIAADAAIRADIEALRVQQQAIIASIPTTPPPAAPPTKPPTAPPWVPSGPSWLFTPTPTPPPQAQATRAGTQDTLHITVAVEAKGDTVISEKNAQVIVKAIEREMERPNSKLGYLTEERAKVVRR